MAQASAFGYSSGTPHREALAWGSDVVALLVLDRRVGADHGRLGQVLGPLLAHLRIEQPGRQAASLDVAQHPRSRASRGDRRLTAQARERDRALRVDLPDAQG